MTVTLKVKKALKAKILFLTKVKKRLLEEEYRNLQRFPHGEKVEYYLAYKLQAKRFYRKIKPLFFVVGVLEFYIALIFLLSENNIGYFNDLPLSEIATLQPMPLQLQTMFPDLLSRNAMRSLQPTAMEHPSEEISAELI